MVDNQNIRKLGEQEAYNRLSALCARAEYCLDDMRKKLRKWQLPEGAEERILKRLVKERFIDENRYAHAYVRDKFRYNRWGSDKIERMLRMKGISSDDIKDALKEISDDESNETLSTLLKNKIRSVKYKTEYELYVKLLRFAVSRGFTLEHAKHCLEDIIKEDAYI